VGPILGRNTWAVGERPPVDRCSIALGLTSRFRGRSAPDSGRRVSRASTKTALGGVIWQVSIYAGNKVGHRKGMRSEKHWD
jgi:hypothetical protein